ncbi:MAG: BTAD domain-containing putative transcriptional regulator [Caldilineaceae bacterium]
MRPLTLTLFGPPRLVVDQTEVQFNQRKPLALLAYLAVTGQSHSRATLATLLWPDYAGARNYLRNVLSMVRQGLGENWHDFLAIDRNGVVWRPDAPAFVDVRAFEAHLAVWRGHNHGKGTLCATCRAALEQAVTLYTDDFLAGFAVADSADFDDWCLLQQEHLRRRLTEALDALSDFHTRQGALATALAMALHRLRVDLLDEATHRRLMELCYADGQRVHALRQYDECVRLLQEGLGVPPAPETDALLAAIRRGQPSSLHVPEQVSATPPASVTSSVTSSVHQSKRAGLPAPLMELVGREQELDDLTELLTAQDVRLVTLTGPGGVGKTRLALEAAHRLTPVYGHGAHFVELAAQRTPDDVTACIARTLAIDVGQSAAPEEVLCTALREREMLLVLDNFEHLPAAAPQVTRLLRCCPGLKVLATSRERLHLQGEHEYRVAPLSLPVPEGTVSLAAAQASDAVELFRRHAVAAQHQFRLDAATAPLVARICARLDGLPLAIELAAARVRYHTLSSLAERLTTSMTGPSHAHTPLDLLTTDRRDAEGRQRSLRAAIDWSYQLLTRHEQMLLRRLAVFVGGWTMESARAVCGRDFAEEIEAPLFSLLDKSLIVRRAGHSGESRFAMLETVRAFAHEALVAAGELEVTEVAMADYFLARSAQANADTQSPLFADIRRRFDADRANIRAFIQRTLERCDVPSLLLLGDSVFLFWSMFPYEAASVSAQIVAAVDGAPPSSAHAACLMRAGYWAWVAGDYANAHPWLQAALDMWCLPDVDSDPAVLTICRGVLGIVEYERGDFEDGLACFRPKSMPSAARRSVVTRHVVEQHGRPALAARSVRGSRRCA